MQIENKPVTEERQRIIKEVIEGKSFGDFISETANLLTAFGVFNALAGFSVTLPDKLMGHILSFCFLILSIMCWWEIRNKSINAGGIKRDGKSFNYMLFEWMLLFIQGCFFVLLIRNYLAATKIMTGISTMILWTIAGKWFFDKYASPKVDKLKPWVQNLIQIPMVVFVLLLSFTIAYLSGAYVVDAIVSFFSIPTIEQVP